MYNLGLYYDENNNFELGEKYYLMAINKGDEEAKHNLAIMYGEWEKYDKATSLFKELGMIEGDGMYYTGMYYKTEKNYKKAEEIYYKMIEMGNPDGYFGLGQMNQDIFKNQKKAIEFYRKGADMKEYKSAFKVANYYFKKDDWKEAKKYYVISAIEAEIKGNKKILASAAYNAGLICSFYEEKIEAKKWFEKALENGEKDAKEYLD